jgi:Zn-dependent peptidase ImmA (M78 family)
MKEVTDAVSNSTTERPDEHEAIKDEAVILLKRARAIGIFPTPIEKLIAAADVDQLDDVEEAKQSFLQTAPAHMRSQLESAWKKLRGFADLKKKVNYIAPEGDSVRQKWPKLHELGHQILPWQQETATFLEDNKSLSPECEERFEHEANDFAGQLLFQADTFFDCASQLYPDFNSVFHIANQFGASRHSTARHFAVESEEPIALVSYYKSNRIFSEDGRPWFMLGRANSASKKLLNKFPNLQVPQQMAPSHAWFAAVSNGDPISSTITLDCGDGSTANFQWSAWWNGYRLLVLIRRAPKFKIVRSLFGS